ncbi:NAD(P)/FAD-dependent oxidoreductase [Pseudonocardiaceae bacterium YIM PH 21723]|nr:NAD(P)/FAD-dependent oxidoreductase [Pseudonocardiaceae bacterium YIM PH 21723]
MLSDARHRPAGEIPVSETVRIVIAGAGLAALRAAERLREMRFDGEIVLVGDELPKPYHRPALSKNLLTGKAPGDGLYLEGYQRLNAFWRLGTRISKLDHRRHALTLPGGEEMRYDGLIIATGMQARTLSGAPLHDPRVNVLRTLADGLAIRESIKQAQGPVVIVGSGFTGCEVASSVTQLGKKAIIIVRGDTLFTKALGQELGEKMTKLHIDHGVQLAPSIKEWDCRPEGVGLKLSDGQQIMAGAVIIATGTIPVTDWLHGSGLILEDGVLCEATTHVVGANDVTAAGDVARWPNLRFGDNEDPRRVEHWTNAVEMGRHAAEALLLGRKASEPFCPMPRFWSEQHHMRIQACGIPALGTDTIALTPDRGGKLETEPKVVGYVRDGQLVGVVGVNASRAVVRWQEELERQLPIVTKSTMERRKQAEEIRRSQDELRRSQNDLRRQSQPLRRRPAGMPLDPDTDWFENGFQELMEYNRDNYRSGPQLPRDHPSYPGERVYPDELRDSGARSRSRYSGTPRMPRR